MDAAVQRYIDAIPAEHRPLFDRFHGLVLDERPDAVLALSYKMPAYTVGPRRLHVGVWRHGLSLYGWSEERSGGFCQRHPQLCGDKGTIRLRPDDAARIPDEDLRALIRAVLSD